MKLFIVIHVKSARKYLCTISDTHIRSRVIYLDVLLISLWLTILIRLDTCKITVTYVFNIEVKGCLSSPVSLLTACIRATRACFFSDFIFNFSFMYILPKAFKFLKCYFVFKVKWKRLCIMLTTIIIKKRTRCVCVRNIKWFLKLLNKTISK